MTRVPELLIVGHVTRDEIIAKDGSRSERLGGAASFGALASASLGLSCGLLTAAPAEFRLAQPLMDHDLIDYQRVPSDLATTFELDYRGATRQVRLLTRATTLRAEALPEHFRQAPVAYLAPVAGECDRGLAESLDRSLVVAGIQGWLRKTVEGGRIEPHRAPELDPPPHTLRVAVFSELDHPDSTTIAKELARKIAVVAMTRGSNGVTIWSERKCFELPCEPADEVDPTGAGDVFGIVLGIGLYLGREVRDAARLAMEAAARVVEGPNMGNLETSFRGRFDAMHRT